LEVSCYRISWIKNQKTTWCIPLKCCSNVAGQTTFASLFDQPARFEFD
jgi:hypothetical protein